MGNKVTKLCTRATELPRGEGVQKEAISEGVEEGLPTEVFSRGSELDWWVINNNSFTVEQTISYLPLPVIQHNYSGTPLIWSPMDKKKRIGLINGLAVLSRYAQNSWLEGCHDKCTRNTPYIAFIVLFSLLNNRNVDIPYGYLKKLLKIFLQYMKLF